MTSSNKLAAFMHQKIDMLDKNEPYSVAACAKLRRAIGKPLCDVPEAWEIILSYDEGMGDKEILSAYTAITLYALHRQGKQASMNTEKVGFGTAVAKLVTDKNQLEPIKRRFNAVATAEGFAELAYHARGLVQLMKAKDIEMDYPKFAIDLFFFQFPESAGKIRLRWGEEFYRYIQKNNNDKENK